MTCLNTDDVLGQPGQNLTQLELGVLVAMANGNSQRDIQEATQTDSSTLRTVELQVRAKLGAKTPAHMVARGFTLGVLIPRAFCLLLGALCATDHADDSNRNQTRRNSRSAPASRLARSTTNRTASGPAGHHESLQLVQCFQLAHISGLAS